MKNIAILALIIWAVIGMVLAWPILDAPADVTLPVSTWKGVTTLLGVLAWAITIIMVSASLIAAFIVLSLKFIKNFSK